LQNTKWIKNATSADEMKKFAQLSETFKKYAGQYDFDYLMIMAQGYQESLLDQKARHGSTVGIMQVNPKLAAASPISVPNVSTAENNIQAGVKMLRQIEQQYFDDPKIDQVDKTMMVFASYNAGPTRIAKLRKQAFDQGLDPNKWFNNVELMVAKDVGQVTVNYVSNIYKYYVAYKLALGDKTRGRLQTRAAAFDRNSPSVCNEQRPCLLSRQAGSFIRPHSDAFCAMIGAFAAQLLSTHTHDRQISRVVCDLGHES
jgi:soluble lytic murein transglycosylase-like protein